MTVPVAPPPNLERMQERTSRLKTMGFTKGEIRPILEAEFKVELSDEDYEQVYNHMQLELSRMPDLQALKQAMGETWARQEVLMQDLLNLYQLLVQHFNAFMTGKTQLDDGTPVRMVKAKDLIGLIQMITRLGQENVNSKMNALRIMPELEVPQLEPGHDPKALMQGFIDLDDEMITDVTDLDDFEDEG